MANKVFLDTNILIDYIQQRNNELDAIIEIFKLGEIKKINLFISESIITTAFYILRKEKIDVSSIFRDLCDIVNIIPFSKAVLNYPLEKYQDTEDGLLYFLAVRSKMDYFITRNSKDFVFVFPSTPVISPTNFLKEIYFNDLP